MTHKFSDRMSGIEEASTLALNAMAKKMRAEGKDVINLTAGEPDFATPPYIITAAQEALARGETRYCPSSGLPQLREAVAAASSKDYGVDFTPANVLICNGAKQALYNVFQLLIQPGDEVIIPAPYWLSYTSMVRLAGGKPVVAPLRREANFVARPGEIEKHITAKTKIIIINSPSNPSGAVQERTTLEALAAATHDKPIYLLFDDIYDKLTYTGSSWSSPFSLQHGAPEKIIAVNGVSKSYAMTGFRIGWSLAAPEITAKLSALESHSTSSPSTVSQWAAVAALHGSQEAVEAMRHTFAKRRDLITEELSKIPDLPTPKIGGAFYAFPDCSAYLGKRWSDAATLAKYLLSEALVATVPGADFGAPTHLRLSFAASEEALKEGIKRIAAALR